MSDDGLACSKESTIHTQDTHVMSGKAHMFPRKDTESSDVGEGGIAAMLVCVSPLWSPRSPEVLAHWLDCGLSHTWVTEPRGRLARVNIARLWFRPDTNTHTRARARRRHRQTQNSDVCATTYTQQALHCDPSNHLQRHVKYYLDPPEVLSC